MGKTEYESNFQKAIKHARREPDVKVARIAVLYGVIALTLRRRLAGDTQDYATAFKDRQLFTPGEEKAIAEHIGTMADCGFPLNHALLRQIAQDMVNMRDILQKGKSDSTESSSSHVVGAKWVDRFLERNSRFKKTYVKYQERARAAVSNDIELQRDFVRKLANLVRRKSITSDNIWNCDEKGKIFQLGT